MDRADAGLIAANLNAANHTLHDFQAATAAVLSSAAANASNAPMDIGVPGLQFGTVPQQQSPRRVEPKNHRQASPRDSSRGVHRATYDSDEFSDCASLSGDEAEEERSWSAPALRGPTRVRMKLQGEGSMEVELPSTARRRKRKKRRRKGAATADASMRASGESRTPSPSSPVLMPPPPERPAVVMNYQDSRQRLLTDISDAL